MDGCGKPVTGHERIHGGIPDGREESLTTASLILQSLYSQIDDIGNKHLLLEDIIDHKQNQNAIDKRDAFVRMKNGVQRRKETTQGVISFPVSSAHARGCRKENGGSTIVHTEAHTRVPENGKQSSWQWRSAFAVSATWAEG